MTVSRPNGPTDRDLAMAHGSETAWERMSEGARRKLVRSLWFLTWIGLLAGLFDRRMYEAVVVFSAAHALLVLVLNRFRVWEFPAQVRIAYSLWVAIGTYVPHMMVFLYIATLGLIGNLFFNYCLMARMLCLLSWNRAEKLSLDFLGRVFLSPPSTGRFKPDAPR